MTRIKEKFKELVAKKEKALIAYIMVGYPNEKSTIAAVKGLIKGGADIIELGFPFSDPLALGAEQNPAAGLWICRVQMSWPQAVLGDELLQFSRVLQVSPQESFFFVLLFGVLLCLTGRLFVEGVRIILDSLGKIVGIQRGLFDVEVANEFQRDILPAHIDPSVAAIAEFEQRRKKRLVTAVNFLQFLHVDGKRDPDIAGPEPVADFSICAARKSTAGSLLVPAHGGILLPIIAWRGAARCGVQQ